MYVCLCHGVSEDKLRNSIKNGNETFCDIMNDVEIAIQCRKCVPHIVRVLEEEKQKKEVEDLIYTEIKS